MRALVAIGVCALLGACATGGGVNTPHANLERAEILAEDAYVNAVPLMSPAQQRSAWVDLQKIRQAYDAGQDISALVSALVAELPKKGA
jgi:hypothetical protein